LLPNDVKSKFYLLISLAAVIWFAALARGAHDLWAVSVLCAFLSLLASIFLYFRAKSHSPITLPLVCPFGALFLGVIISARFAFDVNTAHLEIVGLACAIACFFLFSNLFQEQSMRRLVMPYAGSVMFPLAAIALLQHFRNAPPLKEELRLLGTVGYSHWSAAATFTNSSLYAGLSLSWILPAWHHRQAGRYYQWLFGCCLLSLFLSRSWWALICLTVGFMLYYKKSSKNIRNQRVSIIFFMTSISLFILALIIKFGPGRDPSYLADSRLGWWTAGIRMFIEHPWVGVGLGGYATAFPYFKPSVSQNTLFAHSFPVQVLAETGLAGLLGFLAVGVTCWRRAYDQTSVTPENQAYRATLTILLMFSLTTIFLDTWIGKLMLLMSLSLVLASSSLERFSISKRHTWLTVGILLLLIPSWYLPFRSSQFDAIGLTYETTREPVKAEAAFQKALALNPNEDDSCRGLARLYERRYQQTHSMLDFSNSLLWSREALRLKQVRLSYSEKTK